MESRDAKSRVPNTSPPDQGCQRLVLTVNQVKDVKPAGSTQTPTTFAIKNAPTTKEQ